MRPVAERRDDTGQNRSATPDRIGDVLDRIRARQAEVDAGRKRKPTRKRVAERAIASPSEGAAHLTPLQHAFARHPSELRAEPVSWLIEEILPAGMLSLLHAR